jgi:hypothetical protein
MISVEINTAVKSHFEQLGYPYASVPIVPFSAYDQAEAPFIVYFDYEGTLNEEQYFIKISNVIYYIYDNNISRMKNIAYNLDKFMNIGDKVAGIKKEMSIPSQSYGPYRYRLVNSRKTSGATFPPLEREGFASQSLNFRVVYLDQDDPE